MDQIFKEIRLLISSLAQRFNQLLADTPTRTLQVTGILGLAAVLYGLYHLQGSNRSKRNNSQGSQSDRRASNGGASHLRSQPTSSSHDLASTSACRPAVASSSRAQPPAAAVMRNKETRLSWAVCSQLAGVRTLTISAPGVLLEEWTPSELQDSATLREDAAGVLRELTQYTSVYVVTQVEDDTGEATCRGALEAGGLVGSAPGQIPSQRLLFCSTLDGKVSIVRQLEPQLHIDGHPKTVEDLKRFIKLVHICPPGWQGAGLGSPNVGSAQSLAHLFSVRSS